MQKMLIAASMLVLSAGIASAQEPPRRGPADMLFQADANSDGAVSRAEFDAGTAARFARIDANHDGAISGDERPHPPGAPQGEHANHAPPSGAFNPDANNDGAISRAEFDAQSAQMFARLDADRNGSISRAEADAMRPPQQH